MNRLPFELTHRIVEKLGDYDDGKYNSSSLTATGFDNGLSEPY
jgi:hypothetical protein